MTADAPALSPRLTTLAAAGMLLTAVGSVPVLPDIVRVVVLTCGLAVTVPAASAIGRAGRCG